jgi:hypothetical protein
MVCARPLGRVTSIFSTGSPRDPGRIAGDRQALLRAAVDSNELLQEIIPLCFDSDRLTAVLRRGLCSADVRRFLTTLVFAKYLFKT